MQTDRTRELETKGIGTLLLMYALPSVVSQVISSVYNICDRIFIGHGVGALAIAGLAITLPIINIIHAFGALIGVGVFDEDMLGFRLFHHVARNAIGSSL